MGKVRVGREVLKGESKVRIEREKRKRMLAVFALACHALSAFFTDAHLYII